MVVNQEKRVTTSEFLIMSGISRYDLWNWRKRGMLPGPCACRRGPGPGAEYWYSVEALDRASDIKCLRDQGFSMQLIRKILAGEKVGL